jgi:hypothetical protein
MAKSNIEMAETLRSGPLLVGLAVSLAAHAALLAVHWQAAPRDVQRKAPAVARLTVRMQAAAVAQAAPAAGPVAQGRTPAGGKALRRAVAAHRKPAPAAAVAQPVETPAALPAIPVAEPPVAAAPAAAASAAAQAAIDGSVFGLPRIAFAVASPARWMPPAVRTAAAPIAAPAPPPAAMQAAQGARDIGRQQLLQRLHHQMALWPLPGDAGNGDCTVALDEPLHCDSPALGQALLAQAGPLGGLLQAHHGLEPRTQALAIVFREGRYRVAFHLAGGPR